MFRRALLIAGFLLWTFLFIGFFFHRSSTPLVFQYGTAYAAVLVMLTVVYLAPFGILLLVHLVKDRRPLFALAVFASFSAVLYVGAALHHYYTQVYPFDPLLQLGPQLLEAQYPVQRNPGATRILALGGSTTENVIGISKPEERYPKRLEALLGERFPGRRFEVLNAGRAWYTTQHSLVNYVTHARRWEPDVVVVMHALNDMTRSFEPPDLTIGEFNERWSHFYGAAGRAADPPSFEGLWLGFLADRWFSTARIREREFEEAEFRSLAGFRRNLAALARYVRADGAELVMVTQPTLLREEMNDAEKAMLRIPRANHIDFESYWRQWYPSARSEFRAMRLFNAVTREVAAQHGVALVDAAALVPRTPEYFVDEVHYTPAGADALARAVLDPVAELVSRPAAAGATAH